MRRIPRFADLKRVVRALTDTPEALDRQNALLSQLRRDSAKLTRRMKSLEQDGRQQRSQVEFLTRIALGNLYGHPLTLDSLEVGVSSQHGEDGVLLAILDELGLRGGHFLEIGCGSNGGNTGLLADMESWKGLMLDQNRQNIKVVSSRFNPDRVRTVTATVTPYNVGDLLAGQKFQVVSIDVDSYDLEIADALGFTPVVLVIEYNAQMGPEQVHDFRYESREIISVAEDRYGASFSRICAWAEEAGMSVVHVESSGTNVFLVRKDWIRPEGKLDSGVLWGSPRFRSSRKSRFRERRGLRRADVT